MSEPGPAEIKKRGSALIVGGGIGGMQAALDLAEGGFKAYIVEKEATIGGTMVQLDKTFPTGDCAMCMISPKMVEVGRHPNIDILSRSELASIDGEPGAFKVRIKHAPRSVDRAKCTGCGECARACPVRNLIQVPDFVPPPPLGPEWQAALDRALTAHHSSPTALISILQEINRSLRYLPRDVLTNLSHRLRIPEARVLAVATFYNAFSLTPVGRHVIEVCTGAACHVQGGRRMLDRLRDELKVEPGGTTPDGRFTLRTVNCIGCCALAPAMRVNGETFGNLKVSDLPKLLKDHP